MSLFLRSLPVLVLVVVTGCTDRLSGSGALEVSSDVAGKKPSASQSVAPPGSLFDATMAWPLCGRITENPPPGWNAGQPCPSSRFGSSVHTDAPFSSTFGPRQKASQSFRYDYHRGIDIPTPAGTPLFAVADGYVNKAGIDSGYYDPLIQLRHYRPGQASCSNVGCYYSNYLHVSQWVVAAGQTVKKGQLVGYSGVDGYSGFPHLHFEIRNAPGAHDANSNTSRDTVHPLSALPYADSGAGNITVSILNVDTTAPGAPDVTVAVSLPNGTELDLQAVEVAVFERLGGGGVLQIPQPGDVPVGTTPEGTGYLVNPPSFDMVRWNRQYSYKNTTKYPYSAFKLGGPYESPYAASLPASYDANFHLDHTLDSDPKVGAFNGAEIAPAPFSANSATYDLQVRFTELVGPADPAALCVRARAMDARGSVTTWVDFNCPAF